jgi:hypothetical protein
MVSGAQQGDTELPVRQRHHQPHALAAAGIRPQGGYAFDDPHRLPLHKPFFVVEAGRCSVLAVNV